MADWGIALLVIMLIAMLAVTVGVLFRLFGVQQLVICLSSDEEKAALTQHEKGHGFLVGSDSSEFTLDTGGKYPHYDTMHAEPCVVGVESAASTSKHKQADEQQPQQQQQQQQQPQQQHDDSARSSPVSVGNSSVGYAIAYGNKGIVSEVIYIETASDLDLGHGIRRAESCDSVASDSSVLDMQPDMPKIGQIEFALDYDKDVSELIVSIFQCRDLTPNPYTGTLDTYVKGILMPGGDDKFQTKGEGDSFMDRIIPGHEMWHHHYYLEKQRQSMELGHWKFPSRKTFKTHLSTIRSTTDPVYKERFLFSVEPEQLMGKSLQLQVFSVDKYARQKVIGEADVRVGDIDLNTPIKMWFNLRDIDEKPTEYGDILFSLSYLPTAERLTVVIVKARSLRWRNGKDSGDPFVKVYLLQNGKKISKKRTSVKKGEKNPIFNEAMIFAVPAAALPTVQLRITVAEYQSQNKTPSLGHVIVGAHTSGTEATHWNQMMTSLRKPVAMWHFLRK